MTPAVKGKRRRRWPAFIAGMLTSLVLGVLIWGWQTLQNTGKLNTPVSAYVENDKITRIPPPSLAEMARERESFRHAEVHPHPDASTNERIALELTRLGIEPDQGTMELIATMAERQQVPVQAVIMHLRAIASGSDMISRFYGISLQRRLAADAIPEGTKIKAENLRYEIAMRWMSISEKPWGKEVIMVEMPLPEEKTAILSGFLYAQRDLFSHNGIDQKLLQLP